MSGRIVVPAVSSGIQTVDEHAEAVKASLDRLTGQLKNSAALPRLSSTAQLADTITALNVIIDRLQGINDPAPIATNVVPAPPAPSPAPTPAPAPAPAPAPGPAPAPAPAPGSPPYVPFGSQPDGAYAYGIAPTNYTLAQRISRAKACYDVWKSNRLAYSPTFVASHGGIFAGQTISGGRHCQWSDSSFACVSEGQGYAMLLVVLFAGYDTNAQAEFDALYKVARACPAYSGSSTAGANVYLMDYKLYPDMSSAGGGYNAPDGDLDITLALLMAHRQWGSSGAVNYYAQALNNIAALKTNFSSNGIEWDSYHNVSRTSDYMLQHFAAFKAATNDTFWDNAITNSLAMLNTITSGFSPSAHLQPGFIFDPFGTDGTHPGPVPDNYAHIDGSGIEQYCDANAVRNEWRLACYYLLFGNTTAKTLATNIVAFKKSSSSGDPANTTYAYKLDGTPLSGLYYEPTTGGCLTAGACVDSAHQAFLNLLFTDATTLPKSGVGFSPNYYEAELQLFGIAVAAGCWWKP